MSIKLLDTIYKLTDNADKVDGKHASDFATSGHTHNYAGSSSAGGAATSANKLATARTITLSGSVTGSTSFDGSGNVTISTTTNHGHSYASKVTVGSTAYNVSSNNITIPAYPTSLKCPNSLTIQGNGTSLGSYDGSAAKTINITYSNVGAAAASHTHNYVPISGKAFSQYNTGTYVKILEFTITSGSLTPSISFSWHPTECARDIWADFNINIRSNDISFKANWKGGSSRTLTCVGNGTTFSVWVTGTKTSWDPYGCCQVTNTYGINSYSAGTLQVTDTAPSGTYSKACTTSGYSASAGNADTVDGKHASDFAPASHTHSYASKVTVGSTAYSVSSNNITIPAYPTSLKCPSSLTIQTNGTSQGAWNGSSAKTINITYSNVGAAAASHTHSYLPLSGGTMTGNIKVYTDGDGRGLKFGTSTLNSLSNQLLWQSAEAIRFGSSSWDWNAWAGLKYNHSSKIIYLGLADGTIFNANSAQSGGKLYTPGISNIYIGNGSYTVLHSNNWSSYISTVGIFSSTCHSDHNNNQGQLITRSFMSYWTGAYNSSGSSNLTYCRHGAFGTAATSNKGDFAAASHSHSYIPLSGGTLSSGTSRISRAGSSVSWFQGRANAMMYISSYSGYNAIASMKTTNGDWSLGVYSNNYLYFTYIQDTHYNSSTNTTTAQMIFRPDGYIVGNLSGYATSAGNANTIDGYHISVGSSAGSDASTIYFVV